MRLDTLGAVAARYPVLELLDSNGAGFSEFSRSIASISGQTLTLNSAIATDVKGYDMFLNTGKQYLVTTRVSTTELKCEYIESWAAEGVTTANTLIVRNAMGFAAHDKFAAPILTPIPFEREHEGYFVSNSGKRRMIGWNGDRIKTKISFPYLTEHFMEKIWRCFFHPYDLRFYPQYGNLNAQGNEIYWNVLFPDDFDPQYFRRKYVGYACEIDLVAQNLIDNIITDLFEI